MGGTASGRGKVSSHFLRLPRSRGKTSSALCKLASVLEIEGGVTCAPVAGFDRPTFGDLELVQVNSQSITKTSGCLICALNRLFRYHLLDFTVCYLNSKCPLLQVLLKPMGPPPSTKVSFPMQYAACRLLYCLFSVHQSANTFVVKMGAMMGSSKYFIFPEEVLNSATNHYLLAAVGGIMGFIIG